MSNLGHKLLELWVLLAAQEHWTVLLDEYLSFSVEKYKESVQKVSEDPENTFYIEWKKV